MRIEAIEIRRVSIPFLEPFRTSFGTLTHKEAVILRVVGSDSFGWGECTALEAPTYSSEYVDGVEHVLTHQLLPRTFAARDVTATGLASLLADVKGHPMAKAAIEMAVLDAELRAVGLSLATYLGSTRVAVDAGVSVGIMSDTAELVDAVAAFVECGYRRVKIKIEPGWDVEPVRALRERWPDLPLQVDANAAYERRDARHLARLDEFDLILLEQPLAAGDLLGHAQLARMLRTPICLDESIESARDAADAIRVGAAEIINIKAGRVGGLLEARRVHDVCAAHGVAVWCGGMQETGLGRAANVALASLPGFTLPGDTSASDRYFQCDITPPFRLLDGRLEVPTGPGLGIEPCDDALGGRTISSRVVRP